MGLRYPLDGKTHLRNLRYDVHGPEKSARYRLSAKGSAVAADTLLSPALAAKTSRRIRLALMSAVPSTHHRDQQPGVATGSHPQGIDT